MTQTGPTPVNRASVRRRTGRVRSRPVTTPRSGESTLHPTDPKRTTHGSQRVVPWNRAQILRGTQIFVGLTLIGLLVLFLRGRLGTSFEALRHLSLGIVAVGVLQGFADLLMGGWRIQCLVRAFDVDVSLRHAIAANGGNVFLGGLTPSQTGGGAAQIYVLLAAGVRTRVALIASLVSWLGTIVAFLLVGVSILMWQPQSGLPTGYRVFSGATVVIFSSIVFLFLLTLPRPTLYRGRLRAVLGIVPVWGRRWSSSRRIRQAEIGLALFARLMRVALRRHPWRIAAGFALSALIYLNKFLVAWVIVQGLGLQASLAEVLRLQELQYLVVYFAPTPGASGLAELSASQIMQTVVPAASFGSYVILWRTFTLYLPMTWGGLLLTRTFLVRERSDAPPPPAS